MTIAGINVGHLLGGTAIIEMICTYPGIGRLAMQSITNRDYPMVQGYVLMMAVIYVLVNLIVDILHTLVDPRVKHRLLAEERMGRNYGKNN
jgi:peptide/nickel transport system permease protein